MTNSDYVILKDGTRVDEALARFVMNALEDLWNDPETKHVVWELREYCHNNHFPLFPAVSRILRQAGLMEGGGTVTTSVQQIVRLSVQGRDNFAIQLVSPFR
jgi:hypothetical protein